MIQNVTVFGGSRPTPEDYAAAERLGARLARAGFNVITGGYIGVMEAASRGAAAAGGHVIGITCEEIEAWRPVKANDWVHEERRMSRLRDRLMELIESCDAAIALPGGPGTLTEITMMWNHLLTEAIPPRRLILVGPGWKATFDAFFAHLGDYTPQEQRRWLLFAKDVDQAMEILQRAELSS